MKSWQKKLVAIFNNCCNTTAWIHDDKFFSPVDNYICIRHCDELDDDTQNGFVLFTHSEYVYQYICIFMIHVLINGFTL